MNRSLSYSIVLLATVCWCAGVILPVFLASGGPFEASLSRGIYTFYSHICHQFDSRSIHVEGHKVAVCARCSAIYAGFLFGVVLYGLIFTKRRGGSSYIWLIVAGIPMLMDVTLDVLRVHESTIVTRLATGAVFGVAAALLLVPSIIEALSELSSHRIPSRGVNNVFKA